MVITIMPTDIQKVKKNRTGVREEILCTYDIMYLRGAWSWIFFFQKRSLVNHGICFHNPVTNSKKITWPLQLFSNLFKCFNVYKQKYAQSNFWSSIHSNIQSTRGTNTHNNNQTTIFTKMFQVIFTKVFE